MVEFSVIIATHERPLLLGRAIASVKQQGEGLAQVVVVADAACAETFAIAASHLKAEDRFIQRAGVPGPAESRNIGMANAVGRHIVFLDDDDALSPTFLRDIAPHLTDDVVLYSDYYHVTERIEGNVSTALKADRRFLDKHAPSDVFVKNFIPFSCLVFPTSLLRGRSFHPEVGYEDWDFVLNVASDAAMRHVPVGGPIVYAREGDENRGSANNARLEGIYRLVYKRWPGPTAAIKVARQSFFASAGMHADLHDL